MHIVYGDHDAENNLPGHLLVIPRRIECARCRCAGLRYHHQACPVQKGATAATLKGTISGRATHDYVVGAKAGQTLSVRMSSNNTFLYFWQRFEDLIFILFPRDLYEALLTNARC
jgi:hypothetical protein